jgi:hypothetical protein
VIRTLVRASSAFVGAGTPSAAELASLEAELARMTGALDPRERRLLGLGTSFVDLVARLRFGRRFSRLDDGPARRILDGLGTSRVALLRRLHLSLRMMTQLAWYSDPAHWDECGYDGPWVGRIAVERGPPPDLGPAP